VRNLRVHYWLIAVLLTTISNVYAAVSWSVSGGIPGQTNVGQTYSPVIYTFSNNTKSPSPTIAIIPGPYDSSEFSLNDTCNGQKISPNGSCFLSVTFKALKAGAYSLGLSFKEGNSPFALPGITTTAISPPPPPPVYAKIDGQVITALPGSITVGQPAAPVDFHFVNNSTVTATGVNLVKNYPADFTVTSDDCSKSTELAANATCDIKGTFTPNTAGAATIAATLNSSNGGSKTLNTTTTVAPVTQAKIDGQVTALPINMTVGQPAAPVDFHFVNNSTVTATGVNLVKNYPADFAVTSDDCSKSTELAANATCDIKGTFAPSTPGAMTIAVTLNASNNSTPDASKVSTHTNVLIPVSAQLLKNLPPSVVVGQATPIIFKFTNNSAFPIEGINISPMIASSPVFTIDSGDANKEKCTNTLGAHSFCTVTGTFTPATANSYPYPAHVGVLFKSQNSEEQTLGDQTNVVNNNTELEGSIDNNLPPIMHIGDVQEDLSFYFYNKGNVPVKGIKLVTQYPTDGSFKETEDSTKVNCRNITELAPNQECYISGTFTATAPIGPKSVEATLESTNGGGVHLKADTEVVDNLPPPDKKIVGELIQPLADPAIVGTHSLVGVKFTNNTDETVNGIAITNQYTQEDSFHYDTTKTTCDIKDNNGELTAGSYCEVWGSFMPIQATDPNSAQVVITLTPGGGEAVSVPSTAVIKPTDGRTFKFVNNCSAPVWIGIDSGAVPNKNGIKAGPCQTDKDCPEYAACDPTANTVNNVPQGLCFWKAPAPEDKNYKLESNGGKSIIVIPQTQNIVVNGIAQQWSGAFAGRTGCDGVVDGTSKTCDTGSCGEQQGDMSCPLGKSFAQPATQAEITLVPTVNGAARVDSYDVDIIDGINIPLEFKPDNGQLDSSNAFKCQAAGSPNPDNKLYGKEELGACKWNPDFEASGLTRSDYLLVKILPNALACNDDSVCNPNDPKNPTFCGVNYNPDARVNKLQKVCGPFLGYWTLSKLCSEPGADKFFPECSEQLPLPKFDAPGRNLPLNKTDLYSCNPYTYNDQGQKKYVLDSCYQDHGLSGDTNCCGCVNWQDKNIIVPSTTEQCVNFDQDWDNNYLNKIIWLKKACPTAYSYQFDDKSAGMVCGVAAPDRVKNITNYTITFCPVDNMTGKPVSIFPQQTNSLQSLLHTHGRLIGK
jgi:hypothetical protein